MVLIVRQLSASGEDGQFAHTRVSTARRMITGGTRAAACGRLLLESKNKNVRGRSYQQDLRCWGLLQFSGARNLHRSTPCPHLRGEHPDGVVKAQPLEADAVDGQQEVAPLDLPLRLRGARAAVRLLRERLDRKLRHGVVSCRCRGGPNTQRDEAPMLHTRKNAYRYQSHSKLRHPGEAWADLPQGNPVIGIPQSLNGQTSQRSHRPAVSSCGFIAGRRRRGGRLVGAGLRQPAEKRLVQRLGVNRLPTI